MKFPNPVNLMVYTKQVEAFRVQVSETKLLVTKPEAALVMGLETALLALPLALGLMVSVAFDCRTIAGAVIDIMSQQNPPEPDVPEGENVIRLNQPKEENPNG